MIVAGILSTEIAMENVYRGMNNVMESVLKEEKPVARSSAFLQTPMILTL